jgi:hypothetical protein
VKQLDSAEDFPLSMAMGVLNLYTFYVRTWLFREF